MNTVDFLFAERNNYIALTLESDNDDWDKVFIRMSSIVNNHFGIQKQPV